MNIKYLVYLLRRLLLHRSGSKTSGFTLIELIASIAIATVVISGLMSLVVQLLSTNQQESGQTQTQNDMQLALDYITADLREAVYVYPGVCVTATGAGTKTTTTVSSDYCPGVVNHIKTPPANSMPILAFWKLDPLPGPLLTSCGSASPPTGVPCNSGRTYTLVVYFLRKNVPTDVPKWYGKARLLRYELPNYKSDGTAIANYVSPEQPGVGFRKWPYQLTASAVTNLQTALPGTDNENPAVLVDFVDDTARAGDGSANLCPPDDTAQNIYYKITPDVTPTPFVGVRSFYACVRVDNTSGDGGAINQDVLVFLRGNSEGRVQPGNVNNLPTLNAQVLRRGIVNKNPKPIE
jgi:prepilin-type N-terminal cleavage/methylation domain-containing protein